MFTLAKHVIEGLLEGLANRPDPGPMTCVRIRDGAQRDCVEAGLLGRCCNACAVFAGLRMALDALEHIEGD